MLSFVRLFFSASLILFILPIAVAFLPFHRQRAYQTSVDRRRNFFASLLTHSMETTASLAGNYLIRCQKGTSKCTWSLLPLPDVLGIETAFSHSEGARAWAALYSTASQPKGPIDLQASVEDQTIQISCTSKNDESLLFLLGRILAQWTIAQQQSCEDTEWTIHLLDDTILVQDINADETIRRMFQDDSELVEMVDHSTDCLGKVPRKLVHSHNLLHRGIGLLVTKDHPFSSESQPDLYVHRRTDTKRIFPSLYDMFVGKGVDAIGS